MKRWLIYGAAALTMLMLLKEENRPGTDVARLEPARLLLVEADRGGVSVRTDMGQSGWGVDLNEAVKDMEETASGQVFLDTAEFLLISPDARKWIPELTELLRSSCRVCLAEGVTDPEAVTAYLEIHKPDKTLADWRKGNGALQTLNMVEGRMYLG